MELIRAPVGCPVACAGWLACGWTCAGSAVRQSVTFLWSGRGCHSTYVTDYRLRARGQATESSSMTRSSGCASRTAGRPARPPGPRPPPGRRPRSCPSTAPRTGPTAATGPRTPRSAACPPHRPAPNVPSPAAPIGLPTRQPLTGLQVHEAGRQLEHRRVRLGPRKVATVDRVQRLLDAMLLDRPCQHGETLRPTTDSSRATGRTQSPPDEPWCPRSSTRTSSWPLRDR
jgi:hypothetical protein